MRKWIIGFSVEKACEEGLDLKDIHILRYVIDFMDSGKASKKRLGGEWYYWVSNKNILENNPLLEINLTKSLRKRLKVLIEKGFLDYKLYKDGVSQTFYKKGKRLDLLLGNKEKEKRVKKKSVEDSSFYKELKFEEWED